MRVLVVEDDPALGRFLQGALGPDGHQVSLAADGDQALSVAEELRPELVVLDLGLPGKDGLEVLAEMGARFRSTLVLVLSGRPGPEERVRCFELGADDVVLKPFSFQELRARLKALGRRRGRAEDTVLRFGDLEMDRAERRVTRAGREVQLTATEFSLLESLLRRGGERVSTRMELMREVWRMPAGAGTNIVEVYINYLRRKLGQRLGARPMAVGAAVIRTVRGMGYLLETQGDAGTAAAAGGVRGGLAYRERGNDDGMGYVRYGDAGRDDGTDGPRAA